jgi:hypothetical protein
MYILHICIIVTNMWPLRTCIISHFHISDICYETDKNKNTHYKCKNNAGNLGQGQYNAQKYYKLALKMDVQYDHN